MRLRPAPPVVTARSASPEMLRGAHHGALRVYLDRFLNVSPARLPDGDTVPEAGDPERLVMAAAARFLAAKAPTQRERLQTLRIALRLHRGEPVYEEAG